MMGGKSLKSSQRRSHAAEALGGDWGRDDSSEFSPAPESTVSREGGGNQGNGQAQSCFGCWMKNKRVNSNVPQESLIFPQEMGVVFPG